MSARGLFVVLEGPEGSGKSTLLGPLAERMQAFGVDPVVVREPGGTRAGEIARQAVLDPEHHVGVVAELFFYLAARAELGPHSAAGEALLNLHNVLGYALLALCVPAAVWRAFSRLPFPARLRTIYLALSFAAASACVAESLIGAALVYRHGVGLSPAARTEPLPRPPTLSGPPGR